METKNQIAPYLLFNAQLGQLDKEGNYQFHKDKEALHSYFVDYVNQNTVFFHDLEEKLDYLVKQDYYRKDVLDQYDFELIKSLYKYAYSYRYRFKSFIGALKFYQFYALRTNDNQRFLERYEDRVVANALLLAQGDTELAKDIIEVLITSQFQTATPTFSNSLRSRAGELVSCFLVRVEDDMESIARSIQSALQLSRIGGGVALLISNIREAGAPIKGVADRARGPIPVMKLYEDAFSYADQLGTRPGAGAVYITCHHMDLLSVMDTKRENADEKVRIKTLSLGLLVTDVFWKALAEGKRYYAFSAYDVEKHYGVAFSDMDISTNYDKLIADERIGKRTFDPEQVLEQMAQIAGESGYPYVVNIDHVNRANPIDGSINMSNLCSEILQVNTPSKLHPDGSYEVLGKDISCNLGSVNIYEIMHQGDFGKTIRTATRALSAVSELSSIDAVPSIRHGNDSMRAIGKGAMNMQGFLASEFIHYDSPEAIDFTDFFFMVMNYHSLKASMELAIERSPFEDFSKSAYADGTYFDKYLTRSHTPATERIQELFKRFKVDIPTLEDWTRLKRDVAHHGLYNAYRMAVAPTGSISYVNYATSSIHPVAMRMERRDEEKIGSVYAPAPYLTEANTPYYKNAYELGAKPIIDLYAAATPHVDQGLSLTTFYTTNTTTGDLKNTYIYAYLRGIKTLYYVRVQKTELKGTEFDSCMACEV